MARALVTFGWLALSLAACTAAPPSAPVAPTPVVDASGIDPCLEELLKQTESAEAAPPHPAPMEEPGKEQVAH